MYWILKVWSYLVSKQTLKLIFPSSFFQNRTMVNLSPSATVLLVSDSSLMRWWRPIWRWIETQPLLRGRRELYSYMGHFHGIWYVVYGEAPTLYRRRPSLLGWYIRRVLWVYHRVLMHFSAGLTFLGLTQLLHTISGKNGRWDWGWKLMWGW